MKGSFVGSRTRSAAQAGIVFALALASSASQAGGTSYDGAGTGALSGAGAGQAVEASDASALHGNPALLVRFKRAEASVGVQFLGVDNTYRSLRNQDGAPTDSGSQGQAGELYDHKDGYDATAAAGSLFYVSPIDSKSAFGFGVAPSHGLLVKYDPLHPGRSQGTFTRLQIARMNLSYARRLSPTFSVGASGSYERLYLRANLTVNYRNAAGRLAGNEALIDVLDAAVVSIPKEATASLRMYGYAFNFQVGALWEPTEKTSLGASYRPPAKFTDNKAQVNIYEDEDGVALRQFLATPAYGPVISAIGINGQEISEDLRPVQAISNSITFPDELRLGVKHSYSPKLDLYLGYTRQDFSDTHVRFVRKDSGRVLLDAAQNPLVTQSFRVGFEYRPYKRLALRAGFVTESGAVDDQVRVIFLPDNNRKMLGLGARYFASNDLSMDVGWLRIMIDKGLVGLNTDNIEPDYVRGGEFYGETEVTADIFGFGLNQKF